MPADSGFTLITATTLVNAANEPLVNGQILFTPVDNAGNRLSFRINGSGTATDAAVSYSVSAGAIQPRPGGKLPQLADTLLTSPLNVGYKVTLIDLLTGCDVIGPGYSCIQPSGPTWSLDTYEPRNLPQAVILTGPRGFQGTPGTDGATDPNFTGAISVTEVDLKSGESVSPILAVRGYAWAVSLGVYRRVAVKIDKFGDFWAMANAWIKGALDVTGATTLGSTLSVAGAATVDGAMTVGGNLSVAGNLNADLGFASESTLKDLPETNRLDMAFAYTAGLNRGVLFGMRKDGTLAGRNVDVAYESDYTCVDSEGNSFYVASVFDEELVKYQIQIFGNYPKLTPQVRQLTKLGNNNFPTIGSDGLSLSFVSDRDGSRVAYRMTNHGMNQMPAANDPSPLTRYDLFHHISTGQSLDAGYGEDAFVANTPSTYDLMLTAGPRVGVAPGAGLIASGAMAAMVPLQETNIDWLTDGTKPVSTLGVTKCSTAASTIRALLHAAAIQYRSFWTVSSVVGADAAFLMRGTQAYNNTLAEVAAAKALAVTAGKRYGVTCIHSMQGEQNEVDGTANFDVVMALWNTQYNEDIKSLTGQVDGFPTIWGQVAAESLAIATAGNAGGVPDLVSGAHDHGSINDAQLRAAENYPDQILLACPQNLYVTGEHVHIYVQDQRWNGEYHGQAAAWFLQGKRWTGVRPKSISRLGTEVMIEMHVPYGPLVIDTTYGNAITGTNHQFTATDNLGHAIAVTSVTVVNNNFLKVVVASDPGPGKLYIENAWRIVPGVFGPFPSFVRDSSPIASANTRHPSGMLYNYAFSFRKVC